MNGAAQHNVKVYDVKACRNCAQSKTRCIWTVLSSPACERCYRLNKQCIAQIPHERKPRASGVRKNRIAELEKRIDKLSRTVERDKASDGSGTEGDGSPQHPVVEHQNQGRDGKISSLTQPDASIHNHDLTEPVDFYSLIPNRDKGLRALINIYSTQCARLFPFVPVPECTISIWKDKHPFLLRSICLVASFKDRAKQGQLGAALMRDICSQTLLGGEKNLDVLQGLLVYFSWYHCHFAIRRQGSSQVCNLLSLCIALVADLGLNRPSHRNDRRRILFDDSRKSYAFAEPNEHWTSDEKLALLGCFYVSVIICVVYKRLDAIPYTSHIDNIRQSFLAEGNNPRSAHIDCLVRIQALVYKIDKSFPYASPTAGWQFTAPIGMHVESLRAELASFRDSVPISLKTEPMLELHICTAEVYLHEVSLYDLQWRESSISTQPSQRLDMLYACLQSTKKYINAFIAIPDEDFNTMCWYGFIQLAFVLIVCCRLSVLELPGWNLDEVRKEIDFSLSMGSLIQRMESMNTLAKARWTNGEDDSLWFGVTKKLARVKTWFDTQKEENNGQRLPLEPLPSVLPLQLQHQAEEQQQPPIDINVFSDPMVGLMDDLEMDNSIMPNWFQRWPELMT